MLVRFSIRRILILMLLDCPGSVALCYVAALMRAEVGYLSDGVIQLFTGWGILVFPLESLTISYLLPKTTVIAVAIIWPFFFFVFGVYDGYRNSTLLRELRNVFTAVCVSFVTLAGVLFFTYRNSSRLVLLMFFVADVIVLLSARIAVRGYRVWRSDSRRHHRQVVLIVGAGEVGQNVATQFAKYACADLNVIGYVDDDPGKQGRVLANLRVLGTTADVSSIVAKHYVEDAVIALPLWAHERLLEIARVLRKASVRVHVVPDLFALSYSGAVLQGFGGIPVIDLGWTGISGWRLFWKRAFDVALSSILIVLFVPLMVLIAILIKIDSRGPIIYRQRRIGRNHRPFDMLKFRSMHMSADPEIHQKHMTELIKHNLSLGDPRLNGQSSLKMERDPRVTRVGRVIRKASLDEVPQLFNVLRGDMSLVGPRPPMEYEVDLYNDWHRRRFEAPPGITGLWQVRGRNAVSFDEMVRMDLEYISNQSLWLDLQILAKTPMAVIHGRGAG